MQAIRIRVSNKKVKISLQVDAGFTGHSWQTPASHGTSNATWQNKQFSLLTKNYFKLLECLKICILIMFKYNTCLCWSQLNTTLYNYKPCVSQWQSVCGAIISMNLKLFSSIHALKISKALQWNLWCTSYKLDESCSICLIKRPQSPPTLMDLCYTYNFIQRQVWAHFVIRGWTF